MLVEEHPCQNHTDRIAAEECTMYPCVNTHLCEECSALHGFCHGSKDSAALEKTKGSLTLLGQDLDRCLSSFAEIESRIELYGDSSALARMKEIHRVLPSLKDDCDYLLGRIDNERKMLGGACVPCHRGRVNYNARYEDLSKEVDTLKKEYQSSLYTIFVQIMAKDLSNVIAYMDHSENALVLLHTEAHVKIALSLANYGVKACKTFTVEGGPTVVRHQNKLYVIGGFDKPEVSADCFVVSFVRGQYKVQRLASMRHARYNSVTITTNGGRYIYAIGGKTFENDSERVVKYVEKYDVARNCWTSVPNLEAARSGAGVAIMDDRFIYAYGGISENGAPCNSIEVLDTFDCCEGWKTVEQSDSLWGTLDNSTGAAQIQASCGGLFVATKNSTHVLDTYGSRISARKSLPKIELGFETIGRPMHRQGRVVYCVSTQANEVKCVDMVKRSIKGFQYY